MAGFPPSLHNLDPQMHDLTNPKASQGGLDPKNGSHPVHPGRFSHPDPEFRDFVGASRPMSLMSRRTSGEKLLMDTTSA